ncbi:uncharacterized protein L969DRAFT_95919 [Mixia osmundae IAM 14324]|uniref:Fatty acid desaturase domain-containing protein n=1 Tax=Mixia osmundae (strain CBS 9802 / IAM 14324 / JCM 22182 / KY 12970) TaxID=764103 RepID=G7DX14_MIXOS|nr:uncharacterized protein L969DRAFT_95919 [Mixia osmundae IAM 14324]KEI38080.1 hypothetical protein L969DRAFT_95919 [Mixia osmundae IAM 14324]GAA95111.1 hypothetical protein E5Q_01766 [Mixia osmundae IAM 14324]
MAAIADATLRQRGPGLKPEAQLSRTASTVSVTSDSGASTGSSDSVDFIPPTFTIKELLGCIPKHCFERSALRSGSYIAADLALIAMWVFAASHIDAHFSKQGSVLDGVLGQFVGYALWAGYTFGAGLNAVGLWVIAHECGHQAFSPSKTINNAVGWVLHSALLVPYHSWRISHAKHHAATGHMTRDQVFVPKTRSQRKIAPASEGELKAQSEFFEGNESAFEKLDDLLEDAPIWTLLNLIVQQLFGWPAYLIVNASGQKLGRWTNHFDPNSPIFTARHTKQIIASDIGIGLTVAALTTWAHYASWTDVVRYYLIPYLWVNHWLVLITYLQHTDPTLPHYREGAFNFQRGALCTMDRNVFGLAFHGIAETHICHHLCSAIPHYNAWEATEALKQKLGPYYNKSDEFFLTSLWNSYSQCRFVEDEGDIVFYKNKNGKSIRKVARSDSSDSGTDLAEPAQDDII